MPVFPLLHEPGGTLDDLDEREDNHLGDGNMALLWGKDESWHILKDFLYFVTKTLVECVYDACIEGEIKIVYIGVLSGIRDWSMAVSDRDQFGHTTRHPFISTSVPFLSFCWTQEKNIDVRSSGDLATADPFGISVYCAEEPINVRGLYKRLPCSSYPDPWCCCCIFTRSPFISPFFLNKEKKESTTIYSKGYQGLWSVHW